MDNVFLPKPVTNYLEAYSIPSYVVPIEGDMLLELAKQSKLGIIEIGSWLGRSSCILAEGSKQGNKVPVFCVDKWKDFIPAENVPNCYELFSHNTFEYQYQKLLFKYKQDSISASKMFKSELSNRKFDLAFIDGNHEYESVKADIEAWLPNMKGDWTIAFHDYCIQPWLGVTKAINEYFEDFEVFRSLAVCKKKNLKKKWKKLCQNT